MRLHEIASILRSKNADPFVTTCDIFIDDEGAYRTLKKFGSITPERVAQAYNMPVCAVLGIFFIDQIQAVKVSLLKYAGGKFIASGDLEDDDVLGMQEHVPLANLEVILRPGFRTSR
jgi:hypothetical protein